MRKPCRRVLLAEAAMLAVAVNLRAQSSTGSVYGTVLDEHGAAVAGAIATLTGTAAPRSASTDAKGVFRLLTVPPGLYTLSVTASGFATFTREDVSVSSGKNTRMDV